MFNLFKKKKKYNFTKREYRAGNYCVYDSISSTWYTVASLPLCELDSALDTPIVGDIKDTIVQDTIKKDNDMNDKTTECRSGVDSNKTKSYDNDLDFLTLTPTPTHTNHSNSDHSNSDDSSTNYSSSNSSYSSDYSGCSSVDSGSCF